MAVVSARALLLAAATVTAGVVLAGRAQATALPDSAAVGRALDACVAPLVKAGELSGQLIIARNGVVLVERSWGAADRERRLPMTPTTRMSIASITKPVNQLVAYSLLDRGALTPSDSIGRFLPGFAHGRITVEQLMTHRAGIPHRVTTDEQEERPLSAADVTVLAGSTPLQYEPGTSSIYSSAGYTVLAHVLETVAGKPWGELVDELVLRPAGLVHTVPSAGLSDPLPERAVSYLPGAHGIERAPRKDLGFLTGAGSMWSTARDLLKLASTLLDGGFGAAARTRLVRRETLRWSGSTNGFFSYLDHDSATGLTSVFVGNLHVGAPALLRYALPRLAAGTPVKPIEVPHPALAHVPDKVLRSYEGRYDVAGNPGLPLTLRDGAMWANDWPLLATSDTTFFSPRDYAVVSVARDSTGRLIGMNWQIGPQKFLCPRVGGLQAKTAAR